MFFIRFSQVRSHYSVGKSLYSVGQPEYNPAFWVLFMVKQVLGLIRVKQFSSTGDSVAPLPSGTFGNVWRYFGCHTFRGGVVLMSFSG